MEVAEENSPRNFFGTVLLVDDDPIALKLAGMAIKELSPSTTIHSADTGPAALRFLRGEGEFNKRVHPDVLLLDWNLPGMHGREILAAVKGDAKLRNIPVIILSTSREPADVAEAYGGYANLYVAKELDFNNFMETLARIGEAWRRAEKPPEN